MKYVFFDIECACVYKNVAKICVFGYCIADEQFHILEKEDILINPNGKFHLTDHGGDGIVLPYDYNDFKKYPDFKKFYPRIKALLEGEDRMVFGHAAINDVKYLNLETKRYRLPSFSFRFADTQVLYMAMTETFDRQAGLESLTQIFEIDYTPHCAADDAYATMRIAQEMCAKESCTLPELLEKFSIRFGKIGNYQYSNCSSNRRTEYLREKSRIKRERGEKRARFNDFVYGYASARRRTSGGASGSASPAASKKICPSPEPRQRDRAAGRAILAQALRLQRLRRGGGGRQRPLRRRTQTAGGGKIAEIYTLADFRARFMPEQE